MSTTPLVQTRCEDCWHRHGGAPHGFCLCGCTYPGREEGVPIPLDEVRGQQQTAWSCPDCPWEQHAHPKYGWSRTDDRAVEVHRTLLCPARATASEVTR